MYDYNNNMENRQSQGCTARRAWGAGWRGRLSVELVEEVEKWKEKGKLMVTEDLSNYKEKDMY